MNFQKPSQQGWLTLVSVGVISALAITGCDRSKNEDSENNATQLDEKAKTEEITKSVPAIACDDPLVQDRLKLMLQTTLNQKAQAMGNSYANQANVAIDGRVLASHVNDVLIDVQNPTVLEATNATGVTTCQASVSMTLPSQDLYQANQVYAAAGRASIQERMAEQNIRLNNNMLVDDGFSYVVGTQGGELKIRIAGQPAIMDVVSDVVAGSLVQSTLSDRRAQASQPKAETKQPSRQQQAAPRVKEEAKIRQPKPAQPAAPAKPAKPASIEPKQAPATKPQAPEKTQPATKPNDTAPANNAAPAAPKPAESNKNATAPTDKSIDMVIIEDPNATY